MGLLHLRQLRLLTNTEAQTKNVNKKEKKKKGLSEHLNYGGALVLSGSLSQSFLVEVKQTADHSANMFGNLS